MDEDHGNATRIEASKPKNAPSVVPTFPGFFLGVENSTGIPHSTFQYWYPFMEYTISNSWCSIFHTANAWRISVDSVAAVALMSVATC